MSEKKHEKHHGLRQVFKYTGSVKSLLHNPDGIFDGFVLDGHKEIKIKFPPHLGQALSPEVQTGKEATVEFYTDDEGGKIHSRFVSLTTASGTIHHTPPNPGGKERADEFTEAEGKVVDLALELKQIVIENNTTIKIPRHARDEIKTLLRTNVPIRVTGVFKALKPGEVALEFRRPLHLRTLEVEGKKYAV